MFLRSAAHTVINPAESSVHVLGSGTGMTGVWGRAGGLEPCGGRMKMGGGGTSREGAKGVRPGMNTGGTRWLGINVGSSAGNKGAVGSSATCVSTGDSNLSGGGSRTEVGALGVEEIRFPQRARA